MRVPDQNSYQGVGGCGGMEELSTERSEGERRLFHKFESQAFGLFRTLRMCAYSGLRLMSALSSVRRYGIVAELFAVDAETCTFEARGAI